jgi:hypothetical protein
MTADDAPPHRPEAAPWFRGKRLEACPPPIPAARRWRRCDRAAERRRARLSDPSSAHHRRQRRRQHGGFPRPVDGAVAGGVDHFVFGTDSPPLFVVKKEGVDLINKIGLRPRPEINES